MRANEPSSAIRPATGVAGDWSAMAGFVVAHGGPHTSIFCRILLNPWFWSVSQIFAGLRAQVGNDVSNDVRPLQTAHLIQSCAGLLLCVSPFADVAQNRRILWCVGMKRPLPVAP